MEDVKPDSNCPVKQLEQLLCNRTTPLKDDQCTTIIDKCPCDKQALVSSLLFIIIN